MAEIIILSISWAMLAVVGVVCMVGVYRLAQWLVDGDDG